MRSETEGVYVIPTPDRDALMYNNGLDAYVPKNRAQLREQTNQMACHEVEVAKNRAIKHGLPVIAGRVDLWLGFRSDEVAEAVALLKESISAAIGPGYFVQFIYYEKPDETTLTNDDVRDLTFFAYRATSR